MNYNNHIYFPRLYSTFLEDRIIFPVMRRKNFVRRVFLNFTSRDSNNIYLQLIFKIQIAYI